MINITPELKLILVFTILAAIIICIKFLTRKVIIINTIWFSKDDYLPGCVINNMVQLAKLKKHSPFKKQYKIYFWTNKKRLSFKLDNLFKQHGIIIKDYHDTSPRNDTARQSLELVNQLVDLGDKKQNFLYTLASDIFRFYLLLHELPNSSKHHYSIYIDCNDIIIHHLPAIQQLEAIRVIALHDASFRYNKAITNITKIENIERRLITNDVIISNNKNGYELEALFTTYINNLNNLKHIEKSLSKALRNLYESTYFIDKGLIFIIVFSTTHILNFLSYDSDYLSILIKKYVGDSHEKQKADFVLKAQDYISFTRNYEDGFTWAKEQGNEVKPHDIAAYNLMRNDWHQLCLDRHTPC